MTETERESERQMVTKAAAGDRAALQQLLLLHCNRLADYIAQKIPRSVQSVVSVDDVMQQTFTEVFRNIEKFVPRTDQSFFAWLRKIAERQAQDAVKAMKRAKRGGGRRQAHWPEGSQACGVADLVDILSAGSHTPSRSAARHEAIEAVQHTINGLPEHYRQAVQLRLLEGKSLEETAGAMNCSPRAVQGLIDRAKKKMRTALGRLSLYE